MNEKHQTVTPRLLAMSPHRFWYFETALHPFRGDIFLTDPVPVFFTHTVTFIATTPSTKPHPRGVVSHPRELSLFHVRARRTPHPHPEFLHQPAGCRGSSTPPHFQHPPQTEVQFRCFLPLRCAFPSGRRGGSAAPCVPGQGSWRRLSSGPLNSGGCAAVFAQL